MVDGNAPTVTNGYDIANVFRSYHCIVLTNTSLFMFEHFRLSWLDMLL